MSLTPKRTPPSRLWADRPVAILDYELAQEKATALGRLGRRLEVSLAALAAFDARHPPGSPRAVDEGSDRAVLVGAAATALWHFIVQRDACGLRDSQQIFRHYRVPGEVIARIGAR